MTTRSSSHLHRQAGPAQATSFVGRRRELAEARRILGRSRLLTITGTGGAGKSRLAHEIAMTRRRAFPDGASIVDLTSIGDPRQVPHAVAQTRGLSGANTYRLAEELAQALAGTRCLLVLDNCDRLLDAVADLVLTLLQAAAGVSIVVTSRRLLRIGGESVLPIHGLSVPFDRQMLPPNEVTQHDAIRLFAERAAAASPDFEINAANIADVAKLCHELDGIPLEIELAATRIRALSVRQLVQRLDDRLRLLSVGQRAGANRHRNLRNLVETSAELCSPDELTLWSRLSVFEGSFDLNAAEVICSGCGIVRFNVLDLLFELVDKSIVVPQRCGASERYRLPTTLRQYGRERLIESGAEAVFLRRHRDFYEERARNAEAAWTSPNQVEWFSRLRDDHHNLCAAIEFSLSTPEEASRALELAATLQNYWIAASRLEEGSRFLSRALTACPSTAAARTNGLRAATIVALLHADLEGAIPLLERFRTLAHQHGEPSAHAYVAHCSGLVSLYRGDYQQARILLQQALAGHQATRDLGGTMSCLVALAALAALVGQHASATAYSKECETISTICGERFYRSYAVWAQSTEALCRADWHKATELAREGIRLNRHFNDWQGLVLCTKVLADAAYAVNDPDETTRFLDIYHGAMSQMAMKSTPALARRPASAGRESQRPAGRSFDEYAALALNEPEKHSRQTVSAAENHSTLTQRELQVAELVSRGMSNKQIAAALVISQRTAESHLEHILVKLGFSKRTQIGTWFVSNHEDPPASGLRQSRWDVA